MRMTGQWCLVVAIHSLVLSYCIARVSEAQEPRYVLQWGGLGTNPGQFNQLWDLAIAPDGSLFVLERPPNSRVQHFDANGAVLGAWKSSWRDPHAIAVGPDGSVFVVDYSFDWRLVDGRIVQKFSSDGSLIAAWGTFGPEAHQFRPRRGDGDIGPRNIGVSPAGDVYVTDPNSDRILRFDASGRFVTDWGGTGSAPGRLDSPGDVIASASGDVYVTDRRNNRIQVFASDGTFLRSWGGPGAAPGQFSSPYGMALDVDGNIYVADTLNDRIQKFSSAGAFVLAWGQFGSGDGEFYGAFKVVVDAAQNLFVLDCWNHRIQRFDAAATAIAPTSWGAVKQLFR